MAYTEIDDPSSVFQCMLYTGTRANLNVTFDGNSDMSPNLVWVKDRTNTNNQIIFDSVRGINKAILPNAANAETTYTDSVTAFNSDGFTLGDDDEGQCNVDGNACASWNWKEQAGVFDIVSYTGNGSNRTISHSLGSVPKMMIVKRRDASASWFVYHVSNGNGNVMKLDNSEAVSAYAEYWNSTTPTSSVFSLGTAATANVNNGTFIAYLFGNKQGVSHCGSYIGNGNANGPMIWLGFKPAFLLIKRTTAVDTWHLVDNKRDPHNMVEQNQSPDTAYADNANAVDFDFLSNGFKLKNNDNNGNNSGDKYIYMAFAENPFVTGSSGIPATAR